MRIPRAIIAFALLLWGGRFACAKPVVLHPTQQPSDGEIVWSETDGLLTATITGDGPHQAHIRWDVPSVSAMPDLKSFDISLGTSTGNYDLLSNKQLSAEIQPGANELLIKGLDASTVYYWKVRARDSEDNVGSYCDEQTCTSEAAWTPPSSPTSIGQAQFPLTMVSGTNYQLSEDVTVATGTAIVSANNCSIDFNGHTLTVATSGAGKGITMGTNRTNFIVFDSTATTPGSGGGIEVRTEASHGIHGTAANSTGNVIRDIFIRLNCPDYAETSTWGIDFDATTAGCRIFNVKHEILDGDSPLTPSLNVASIKDLYDTHVYGCEFNLAADDGRLYAISDCDGPGWVWANTALTTYDEDPTTFNGGWFITRDNGGAYVHDNEVTSIGDGYRVLFCDGQSGLNARFLWNTVTASNPNGAPQWMGTVFDCRNDNAIITPPPIKNVAWGFNTVTLVGDSAPHAFRFDGVGWIGPPATGTSWQTAYNYHNTANDIYLTRGGLETGNDHTGVNHWSNTYNRKTGFTGIAIGWGSDTNTTETAVEYFNNITINGSGSTDVSGPPSTATNVTWHVYSPWSSGDSSSNSRITYEGAWTGYDPNGDSVPTPTGMSQVTGVH